MKKWLFCAMTLVGAQVHAQYTVRLIVNTVATRQQEDIYIAGNFNAWNPKDENYKLKPYAGGRKSIVMKDVAAGTYAFKCTRGSFDKVECAADGRDISDRIVEVNNDVTLEITVAGWKDDYLPERPGRKGGCTLPLYYPAGRSHCPKGQCKQAADWSFQQ